MNGKIVFVTLFVIALSFISLIIFAYYFPDETTRNEQEFYSHDTVPNKAKIFLIGASGVGSLNATFVNEQVADFDNGIIVYNLGKVGDLPEKRIRTLDKIVAINPKMVVYGIDFRDFQLQKPDNITLPNPQEYFRDLFSVQTSQFDFLFFNPRLVTQQMIQDMSDKLGFYNKAENTFAPYTPLIPLYTLTKIISADELNEQFLTSGAIGLKIDSDPNNKNLIALKKIIKTLQNNNIKVILYTAPHHKAYFDGLDKGEEKKFNEIMQSLEKEFNIKIYFINHKYETLPIWANTNHVAFNEHSLIYSEDIGKIILDGLSD